MDLTKLKAPRDLSADSVARGLGWFSIGLGLAEVLMPRAIARGVGMRGQETLLQAYGAREIATGIGILYSENRAPWIWGRVAGDVLDLATLATRVKGNRRKGGIALAIGAVAGVAALDAACAQSLTSKQRSKPQSRAAARDYSDRVGMPKAPELMRGAASDFQAPRDMRAPDAMRPRAA